MRFDRSVRLFLFILFVTTISVGRAAAEQQSLQVVKDLYASAAYEDALSAVAKLDATPANLEAEQYRVFCLVALGRMDEADRAVESVLMAHPEYRPAAADASPRIVALFTQVRRRIGPGLVKRMYQLGKSAMERKDREEAIAQFEAMLRIADDADVRDEPNVAELKDLGTGFLELSRAMPAKPAPAPVPTTAAAAPARTSVVVPPVVIRQQLPPWVPDPVSRATEFHGAVRVLIGADGRVTQAEIAKSVHPAYDQLLLRAARGWLYEPARKDGAAISSEKIVEIAVTPPARQGRPADKSQPF